MSIVFTEVRIEDRDGVELSFMEGGCLDEFDIRELLKHDQPFRDMWDAVGSDARIAVQQYRFRGGKQGEELGDENHFALMRAYDVVEGPMADDTIFNYVQSFLDGEISRAAFWELAKFKYPTHQISFHTARALAALKFERSYVANVQEKQ